MLDHLGRIRIPVVQNTAVVASPLSHFQGHFPRTAKSAAVANRRGRRPLVNFDKVLARPLGFVFDLHTKTAPTRVGYRPSKSAVLLHVLDRQILDNDRLVFVNQPSSQLVLEVTSGVGDTFVCASDEETGLGPVL